MTGGLPADLGVLLATAATVGVFHTLVGPDHYLPFIVLARARNWSAARTAAITLACGVGHVVGSIALGALGIAAGMAVSRLTDIEAQRGELAAWALIALGTVYAAWGLHRALAGRGHRHAHGAGGHHHHDHGRLSESEHLTAHAEQVAVRPSVTPWVLFVAFVLGPCEPLIPLLMYPAATHSPWGVAAVAGVFALATLATMLAAVAVGTMGVRLLPLGVLERYRHALAGAAIAVSGLGIRLLGL